MTTKTLDHYKRDMANAIAEDGPYAHNIVSCILRLVDKHYGKVKANQLVAEFELTDLFNIKPQ